MKSRNILLIVIPIIAISIALYALGPDLPDYNQQAVPLIVKDAISHYSIVGQDAFADYSTDPRFRDGQIYVFVTGPDDVIMAHGANQDLIGVKSTTLVDKMGTNIGDLIRQGATPEGDWVEYYFTEPSTGDILLKSSYVQTHDGYIFGAGYYHTPDS